MVGFARAIGAIALTLGLGAAALFLLVLRPATGPTVGDQPSSSVPPAASASASQVAVVPPTASPSSAPTATPEPTQAPTVAPCDSARLAARITLWEGAAGSRIATVELTNTSSSPCIVRAMSRPQLVDGKGSVLIDGAAPGASAALTVRAGEILKTLVEDSNYCGPAAVAPVSVAFILGDGSRIVATPFSPADATVPPCNGAGSPAAISMHPWAP